MQMHSDITQQMYEAVCGEQDLWGNGCISATKVDLGNNSEATQLCLGSLLISLDLVAACDNTSKRATAAAAWIDLLADDNTESNVEYRSWCNAPCIILLLS